MASRKTHRIQGRLGTAFVLVEGGIAKIPTILEPEDTPRMLGAEEALNGLSYGDPEVNPETEEIVAGILALATVF